MDSIARLTPVGIRDIWLSEDKDFTPWLADHADLLGAALSMDLVHQGTEVPVGQYSADLVFREVSEESREKLVVVENMFDTTDHDHVGKLITYAAGLKVGYAVLLAPKFRDEHRSALNWLNTISSNDFGFFGLVLKVWSIGDSPPAPQLLVDVQPDNWSRSVRAAHDSGLTETQQAYLRFWDAFLPEFRNTYPGWTNATKPSKGSWMAFSSSRSGLLRYNAAFCWPDKHKEYRLRAEAYIDTKDQVTTKEVYDQLYNQKEQIEQAVGEELEWDRIDDKRASRVSFYFPDTIRVAEEERWPEARPWLIQAMGKMKSAFNPILEELDD